MTNEIIKYDFKEGLSQEFEILDITKLFDESREIITSTHRTEFYHIIWFKNGAPTHIVDFNPVKIEPNTILFLNKDIVHRFDSVNKFEGKVILFTNRFFCQSEADIKFLQNSILFNDLYSVTQIKANNQSDLLEHIIAQMEDELLLKKDNFQAAILQNLLHNFMLHAERERRKQDFTEIIKGANLDYVLLFKNMLESNYRIQKKVSFYAQQLNITEKRLNQATTKILGKTSKQLIDDRILLEAKRIIAHSTDSVKEIAYYLGFEEPTNFIKYFKKHSGLTPTDFREKNTLA